MKVCNDSAMGLRVQHTAKWARHNRTPLRLRSLRSGLLSLALVPLALLFSPLPGLAQTLRPEIRDPFLADPLLDQPRDPLLPTPEVFRPLSPLEQYQLEMDLDALDQQALALWQAEQEEQALEVWIREVRLRRLLGLPQEVAAIQRVGRYAWSAGRTQEVQLLTVRLQQINQQIKTTEPLDGNLLQQTAVGFEILGAPNDAIAIYRQLADLALTAGNPTQHRAFVEKIAALQNTWLQFADAAATYRELYQLQPEPSPQSVQYLRQEINNLQRAQAFEQAIPVQLELIALYETLQTPELIPEQQRAIAQNYQTLGNLDAASRYYQAAYTNAITLEQFEVASQVIDQLAGVYRSLNQLEDVLYLYQQQLLIGRKAYDAFGIMNTFDQMGQLYEQLGQPDQAVAAFREGLILARHLKHRQDYFAEQVRRLSPNAPDQTVEPSPDDAQPATLPLEAPTIPTPTTAPTETWQQ